MDETSSVLLCLLYSCKQLPVRNQDIPAESEVYQFSEFNEVYISQFEYQIGLLLRNNNRIVLQPQKVVVEPSGSYVIRTSEGWAVYCAESGCKQAKSFFCNSLTIQYLTLHGNHGFYEQFQGRTIC